MPLPPGFAQMWNPSAAAASSGNYDIAGSLGFGIPAQQAGLQELFRLISQRGKTDPRMMNMNLADVSRGTQSAQDATAGMAARSGLGGSGVMQAIQASQGQGGMALRSRLKAQDAANADQNQRMNLAMLRDLVIGPGLDYYLGERQLAEAARQRRDQRNVGYASAIGSMIPG